MVRTPAVKPVRRITSIPATRADAGRGSLRNGLPSFRDCACERCTALRALIAAAELPPPAARKDAFR